jgi:hypothetical protein
MPCTAWLTEKNGQTRFLLKGAFGFTTCKLEQLEAAALDVPRVRAIGLRRPSARHYERGATIAAGARELCDRERVTSAVLIPIVCRDEIVGLLGIFYRNPRDIARR